MVDGAYFDGRHAVRHDVRVSIDSGAVVISGDGVSRREPLADVEITDPLGSAPRLVRFGDGAFCSIEDRERFAAMLAPHGFASARVTQWEGSVRWIAISAAAFLLVLVAGYYVAVPALAGTAAALVPRSVVEAISRESLSALDRAVFEETRLPRARQQRILSRFNALQFPPESTPDAYDVVFRHSEGLGPNALALPSGTIVVTDDLVALTAHDDEIVAVLAHEAGHVERRHGLRQLIQNSTVALAMTWLLGDISILAATAPTVLLQARYSRDLEREADRHAAQVLDTNGIPRDRFVQILERLENAARQRGASADPSLLDYLSSHPVTRERIEALSSR